MSGFPRLSAAALVVANLVPLAGVAWFGWAVFDVLLLYWAENVVVGVVNILRMLVATGTGRWFLVPFFTVHYGLFCYGHYLAVVGLFGEAGAGEGTVFPGRLWFGVAAIAASHLLSFWFNFIGQGEYRRASARDLMHRPYGRIVALHVSVIGGGFAVSALGSPVWMLVILVVVKTVMDLGLHRRERAVLARPRRAAA